MLVYVLFLCLYTKLCNLYVRYIQVPNPHMQYNVAVDESAPSHLCPNALCNQKRASQEMQIRFLEEQLDTARKQIQELKARNMKTEEQLISAMDRLMNANDQLNAILSAQNAVGQSNDLEHAKYEIDCNGSDGEDIEMKRVPSHSSNRKKVYYHRKSKERIYDKNALYHDAHPRTPNDNTNNRNISNDRNTNNRNINDRNIQHTKNIQKNL